MTQTKTKSKKKKTTKKTALAVPSVEKATAKLAKLDPESSRAMALVALRSFRAAWYDLGHWLNTIAFGGDYKVWGFDDFPQYCAKELGLKSVTVKKLMMSYNYLKKNKPKLVEAIDAGELPTLPGVEVTAALAKVEQTVSDTGNMAVLSNLAERAFECLEDEKMLTKEVKNILRPPQLPGLTDERELQQAIDYVRRAYKIAASCERIPEEMENVLMELQADLQELKG